MNRPIRRTLAALALLAAAVPATAQETPRDTPDVQLEIVLRNGRRLLVPSSVAPEVLARLLPALEGR